MDVKQFEGHTPWPWFVADDDRPGMSWNRHIHSSPGVAVCFMAHSDGKNPAQDEANARLIAAAPELLLDRQSLLERIELLIALYDEGNAKTGEAGYDDWERRMRAVFESARSFCALAKGET